MRRLGRWLLNGLTILSLLLLLATVVLWVRSSTTADRVSFRRVLGTRWVWLQSNSCQLSIGVMGPLERGDLLRQESEVTPFVQHEPRHAVLDDQRALDNLYTGRKTDVHRWRFLWFYAGRSALILPGLHGAIPLAPVWSAAAPHWFAAVLTAIVPARRLAGAWGRWLSRRRGLCPVCGYDLRATPGRCPECGAVVGLLEGVR